ncbi:DUF1059 domain-containing protein [Haloferax sp. YSMS24]|uniref:DUF1059 domain-containing protein n=1 Tax=unclassified Haloferax TaxID=2625095 RepID=UPI00398D4248
MVKLVACRDAGYDCDFEVRSENEEELIRFVREHAQDTHGVGMSSDDVRGAMKTV